MAAVILGQGELFPNRSRTIESEFIGDAYTAIMYVSKFVQARSNRFYHLDMNKPLVGITSIPETRTTIRGVLAYDPTLLHTPVYYAEYYFNESTNGSPYAMIERTILMTPQTPTLRVGYSGRVSPFEIDGLVPGIPSPCTLECRVAPEQILDARVLSQVGIFNQTEDITPEWYERMTDHTSSFLIGARQLLGY